MEMLLHSNILMQPPKSIVVSDQVLEELEEYEGNCRAVYFRVVSMYKKTWRAIQQAKDNTLQMSFYFRKFMDGIAETKADRIRDSKIRKVLSVMQSRLATKRQKQAKKQLAINHSIQYSMARTFKEWRIVSSIQKSNKTLSKLRLTQFSKELLLLLRENKQRNAIRRLATSSQPMFEDSIHSNYLKKKTFLSLLLCYKMGLVESRLKSFHLKGIIKSIRYHNKYSRSFVSYRSKRLLSSCFQSWKQNYKESIACRFRKLYILARSFEAWRDNLEYFASQREMEKNNECIISIFRDQKCKQLLIHILYAWREQAKQTKEMRRQNSIVNKYANLKHREILLRKYFQLLKTNCINGKIRSQFYGVKLKRKVIEGLKLIMCQSANKEERIINFIEKVERKKYFDRIKRFNSEERKKVTKFRLQKMFSVFTLSIVYQYYQKSKKANAYYHNNLLYKSLFALKDEVTFAKKANYCIIYLNAIRPLRRWTQQHRAINYQHQRQWLFLKKIFREWRLLLVRANSAKKLTRQFSIEDSVRPQQVEDSKLEAFQFENIMATIAKIRKNFLTEKQETLKNESARWPALHQPSLEIDFSLSKENLHQSGLQ